MLFPLPEASLFRLDLLREALPELLLFLLELGVVELLNLAFAVLTSFHLLLAVVLVVRLFGGGDKVQHVGANKKGAQLAEIAVVLVLDCNTELMSLMKVLGSDEILTFGDTPKVFTSLDNSPIRSLNILGGADDGERNRVQEELSMLSGGLILRIHGRLINMDVLRSNDIANLEDV